MKDFFISFSSADRTWAEWIAWQLQEAGYTLELQGWTWGPGSNFVLEMDRAARETRRTLLVLSPSFFDSRFTPAEWAAAFGEDPESRERRLLPVRVRPSKPGGLLGPIVHVDLVDLDEESARRALLDGLKPPGPPDEAPIFPGSATGEAPAGAIAPPPFPGALPPQRVPGTPKDPKTTAGSTLRRSLVPFCARISAR